MLPASDLSQLPTSSHPPTLCSYHPPPLAPCHLFVCLHGSCGLFFFFTLEGLEGECPSPGPASPEVLTGRLGGSLPPAPSWPQWEGPWQTLRGPPRPGADPRSEKPAVLGPGRPGAELLRKATTGAGREAEAPRPLEAELDPGEERAERSSCGVPRVGGRGSRGAQVWPAPTASLFPQVREPPESRRPSRHWSVSIDERRRLATQGGWEEPGTGGPTPHGRVRGGRRGEAGHRCPPLPGVRGGRGADGGRGPHAAPSRPCPLTPRLPSGHRAARGPAGVRGRGQGRAPPPPSEVL